jgi:hypothetical protein
VIAVTRGSLKGKAVVSLLVISVIGGWLVAPSVAHDNDRISHNWGRHYKRLAKKIFYTKGQSNARFVNVGEQASNAALLDGLDSTAFASASHVHSGDDITSGTIEETVIDVLIARVADVFDIVLAADGAGSTLDADLLDGLNSAAFAGASHDHSGDDITTGTVDAARIDALLTRDAEVFDIVTGADGTGSGLDADLLDGQTAADFAGASHAHSGEDITTGTVDEAVIDVLIARVSDVFDIVLSSDGLGSGLDADLLDGQSSDAFAPAGQTLSAEWFKEAADSSALTATPERVVFTAPEDVTISDVFVEPAAALTASDTAYATIVVSRRDATGGGKVTLASRTTQTTGGTGSWTAFSTVALGSLSNTSLAEGQKLTIEVTKTGLGVALPVLIVQIEYAIS